jgi:hypothetical protein
MIYNIHSIITSYNMIIKFLLVYVQYVFKFDR